jgi:hypothetical protein
MLPIWTEGDRQNSAACPASIATSFLADKDHTFTNLSLLPEKICCPWRPTKHNACVQPATQPPSCQTQTTPSPSCHNFPKQFMLPSWTEGDRTNRIRVPSERRKAFIPLMIITYILFLCKAQLCSLMCVSHTVRTRSWQDYTKSLCLHVPAAAVDSPKHFPGKTCGHLTL